ncbi:MAG TPA: dockerin type I repeat-containing protein [Tepidisphaeraceae bacterium]|nr:dockerin type I repeat-containing protein [Tepidisphaeraceae bacterium]
MSLRKHSGSSRRPFAVLALAIAAIPSLASAEKVSLDLGIDPDNNQLSMTVSAALAVGTRSAYQFPTVSGNVLADLDLAFDPNTYLVSSINTLALTGGTFSVSDTLFQLDWGFFIGSVELTGKSVRGTFATPNPPAPVTGNTFNAADHQAILDSGLLTATGTGLVGAYLPQNPYVTKLWDTPVTGTGEGTGTIDISAPTLAGSTATYGVTFTLPVNIEQVVLEGAGATATVKAQGTFQATAQFSHTFAPPIPTWNIDSGGSWANPANWSTASIPNAPAAQAYFTDKLTTPNAPALITLDGDRTVGEIYFRNANSYHITPGSAGSLTLNNAGQDARIQVAAGSHSIAAPLHLADHASIDVGTDSRLDLTGGITAASGKNLTKKGSGLLRIRSGIVLDSASTLAVEQGTLNADRLVAGTLHIGAGALTTFESDTPTPVTNVLHALDIAGSPDAWEGTLDINRSRLVIQADAQTAPDVLAQVINQVKTGRANGWNGQGITSSAAREQAKRLTGVAVMPNDDGRGHAIWPTSGVPDNLNAVFVMYTWNGDVTLDGKVDLADYFLVDAGFITQKGGYRNGDLNYDGKVDLADYFLIDSAFIGQTGVLSTAPVPEPTGLSLLMLASFSALVRRRR